MTPIHTSDLTDAGGRTGNRRRPNSVATILDVARRAHVSRSTVSNFLNDRLERMTPATRRRIEHAIANLGYLPSQTARQLRTGRSRIIALVVPSVSNPFWGALAHALETAALSRGHQIVLCNSERDPTREHWYLAELWKDGVRDVILGSSHHTFDHLAALIASGLTVIAFDHTVQHGDPPSVVSISVDNRRGAYLATHHLVKFGHRRIAFVSGPIRTVSRMERLSGYREALATAGIPFDPQLVWSGGAIKGSGDTEGAALGRQGGLKLLRGRHRPTAIVTVNDMYALGVLAGARALNLEVPRDLSVVGFDDILLARLSNPPLTTVRQPLDEMAEAAIERLHGRQGHDLNGSGHHLVLPPSLIVRSSTAPVLGARIAGHGRAR